MTMCLAAKADFAGESRIVFCCDFLAADDYCAVEDVAKYDVLSDGLMALYAGPLCECEQAVRLYKQQLKSQSITEDNVLELLWGPMDLFRKRCDRRNQYISDQSPRPPDVELLIFGFVETVPKIFYVGQATGDVVEQAQKSAIGTGASAAMTVLDWRFRSSIITLELVLYAAYEAKKMAEAGPPVGKEHTILGFVSPKDALSLTVIAYEDMQLFQEAFGEFGPKVIGAQCHLPGRITGAVVKDPEWPTHDLSNPPASQG